jgi:hypothetical protein
MPKMTDLDEFKKMPPHSKRYLTTKVGRAFERLSYLDIFAAFLTVIAANIVCFVLICPHCLKPNDSSSSFFNVLYFSLVTFTTLGYGDILPVGFGRLMASATAISGLLLAALFIGKLSSERQSTLLTLLYTSDVERRLSRFSEDLALSARALREGDEDAVKLSLMRAEATLEGSCRYIVFNSMQASMAKFGNDSSFREICSNTVNLASALKSISQDGKKLQYEKSRSKARSLMGACERLLITVHHVHSLDLPDSYIHHWIFKKWKSIRKRHFKGNDVILETPGLKGLALLKGIMDTDSVIEGPIHTIEKMKIVRKRMGPRPQSGWRKGIHKEIAKEIGISNSEVIRYVDILKERKLL